MPKDYKDPIDFINKMAAELGLGFSRPSRNRLLLYRVPKDWQGRRMHFGYSPWKEADGKFYAYKYRENKRKGTLTLVKKLGFARRKIAAKRAWQWLEAYYGKDPYKRGDFKA
jgi:hypothetical protein